MSKPIIHFYDAYGDRITHCNVRYLSPVAYAMRVTNEPGLVTCKRCLQSMPGRSAPPVGEKHE